MGCCKCEEHGWADPQPVVYADSADGKEYCVFHAPKENKFKKLGSIELNSADDFNQITVVRFSKAFVMSGVVFPFPITLQHADRDCESVSSDFTGAVFYGCVIFRKPRFSNDVKFIHSKFMEGGLFECADFARSVDFTGAMFCDVAFVTPLFRGGGTSFKRIIVNGVLEFSDIKLQNDGDIREISFADISKDSMANMRFTNQELWCMTFHNCQWPDSIALELYGSGDEDNLRECEDLYRALKQRALIGHNQPQASNWHYREKMMRLNRGADGTLERMLLNTYSHISGFGEKPGRALLFLSVLLFLPFIANSPVGHSLWRFWYWMPEVPWLSSLVQSIGEAINASAAVQYIPFTKDIKGDGWQKVGQGLWQAAVILQFTLFALAVRNRFRR